MSESEIDMHQWVYKEVRNTLLINLFVALVVAPLFIIAMDHFFGVGVLLVDTGIPVSKEWGGLEV